MAKTVVSRIYTVPLRDAWKTSRKKRVERAINLLRSFAARHMKSDKVKIAEEVNELIWEKSIQKPPRKIKVLMEKDEDGVVTVSLPKEEEAE
ncbi:MAG: 50S ribosomal protein L31e [Nitrososphaerota archaeon]|nr:60S ribosomal protein L31 [Aigarchaeota archaeon]MDW8076736.1 50S ribosomal protein L31e [Nitrososphaerota archaeon]